MGFEKPPRSFSNSMSTLRTSDFCKAIQKTAGGTDVARTEVVVPLLHQLCLNDWNFKLVVFIFGILKQESFSTKTFFRIFQGKTFSANFLKFVFVLQLYVGRSFSRANYPLKRASRSVLRCIQADMCFTCPWPRPVCPFQRRPAYLLARSFSCLVLQPFRRDRQKDPHYKNVQVSMTWYKFPANFSSRGNLRHFHFSQSS